MTKQKLYTAEQMRDAFVDGFDCGADHNNLPYKYPPPILAWWSSETRLSTLNETISPRQQKELDYFDKLTYADAVAYRGPPNWGDNEGK